MHDLYFYSTDLNFFSKVGSGLELHARRLSRQDLTALSALQYCWSNEQTKTCTQSVTSNTENGTLDDVIFCDAQKPADRESTVNTVLSNSTNYRTPYENLLYFANCWSEHSKTIHQSTSLAEIFRPMYGLRTVDLSIAKPYTNRRLSLRSFDLCMVCLCADQQAKRYSRFSHETEQSYVDLRTAARNS